MSGFVYFVQCQDRIKIGFSEDPAARVIKIRADAPFPCTLLGCVPVAKYSERELHMRFANLRVHGEWFLAASDLVGFVQAATASPTPTVEAAPPPDNAASLLELIEHFLLMSGMGAVYFGKVAANDSALVARLRSGKTPTGRTVFVRPDTEASVREFIADRTPLKVQS